MPLPMPPLASPPSPLTTGTRPLPGPTGNGWVVSLGDGDRSMADLLGGKGANLAEMTRLGLPVPAGFVVTTRACRHYLRHGQVPEGLWEDLDRHYTVLLEASVARGTEEQATLVSVRSGGRVSMPGMMNTVLDVGLTDAAMPALVRRGGDRFAWDCHRRLAQMWGETVLGLDSDVFESVLAEARETEGVDGDHHLGARALEAVTRRFREALVRHTGEDLPQDPREQLRRAVTAVFESWNGERAHRYRQHEGISDLDGTAVSVVEMVFGNAGAQSGSGVCFTRDPVTGDDTWVVDYLPGSQGEDVVNGRRDPWHAEELVTCQPAIAAELRRHADTLERHYADMCDVEFTYEAGRLWILQTRVGKRSPAAAFRIAADLLAAGTLDEDTALLRVTGEQLETLLHDEFDDVRPESCLASGLAASPGAAVGPVVFTSADAVAQARAGRPAILVRPETSAADFPGMLASAAVITARGGLTSHAAVVARGVGRPCVAGIQGMHVDPAAGRVRFPDGSEVTSGEVLSVDGTSGQVYAGSLRVCASPVAVALRRSRNAPEGVTTPRAGARTIAAVTSLLTIADRRRRLRVRANAENATDAWLARAYGAEGVGLCRTEHMLMGADRILVEQLLLGEDPAAALTGIETVTRERVTEVLRVMHGLPVVIRLLDPPLHEFLPDLVDLSVAVAVDAAAGRRDPQADARLARARELHEANPMLGLRGVRLLTTVPELVDAQVRGVQQAAAALRREGVDVHPELMVPLVADVHELSAARARIDATGQTEVDDPGDGRLRVGVMIELPRAALTAAVLATEADFFSFGTNDLTQTTWGMSRDDAQSFLPAYRDQGLVDRDIFASLDPAGVGRLVRLAIDEGRAARAELEIGVCGEHAADARSIAFLHAAGVDYVSCSPHRIPVARLEAGRAAVSSGAEALAGLDHPSSHQSSHLSSHRREDRS